MGESFLREKVSGIETDRKVLSSMSLFINRATFSVDFLETSIFCHAPFQADFSWDNVGLSKCRKAPFVAEFLDRFSYDLHRNKVNSQVCLNG